MSAAQAIKASSRLYTLCGALGVVRDASEKAGRPTKKKLSTALKLIQTVLGEKLVRDALTHHTTRECSTGVVVPLEESEEVDPEEAVCELSWTVVIAELSCATNCFVMEESRKAKGSFAVASQCLEVLLLAVKQVIAECGAEVLRELTLALVKYAATWFSEPKAFDLMPNAWRFVQALMENACLREMVAPASYKFLLTACFQQMVGAGEYYSDNDALFSQVRHVFVLLATGTPNGLTMLEKCSAKFGKSDPSKGLPIYAVILDKACRLVLMAKDMPSSRQRHLESTALAAVAAVMSDRVLELQSSDAAHTLLQVVGPCAVGSWSEKRHRPSALLFARCIVRLLPCAPKSSNEMDLLRRRVQEDFNAVCSAGEGAMRNRGAVLSELEDDLVDVASFMFPIGNVVSNVGCATNVSSATAWLRVLHAQLARRTNQAAMACLQAVEAVVFVYRAIGRDSHALPSECAIWCARVVREVASISACLPSADARGRRASRSRTSGRRPRQGKGDIDGNIGLSAALEGSSEPGFGDSSVGNNRDSNAAPFMQTGFGSVPREASSPLATNATGTFDESEAEVGLNPEYTTLPATVWISAYECFVRQLMRGRMTARRSGTILRPGIVPSVVCETEVAVLDVMTLLLSIGAVSGSDAATAAAAGSSGGPDTLWSISLFDSCAQQGALSAHILSFLRTHVSVAGFSMDDGGAAKLRLVRMLAGVCDAPSDSSKSHSEDPCSSSAVQNAASAAVGLIRGSCRLEAVGSEPLPKKPKKIESPGAFELFDAVDALLTHSDETSCTATVSQSNYFHGVKAQLEKIAFPSGGGWDDRFLLDDRDLAPSPELILQRMMRPARSHVDRDLRHSLEESLLSILSDAYWSVQTTDPSDEILHSSGVHFAETGNARALPVGRGGMDRGRVSAMQTRGNEEIADRDDLLSGNWLDDGIVGGEGDVCGELEGTPGVKCFPSVDAAVVSARIMAFLGEYFAEGIHVGTLSISQSGDGESDGVGTEVKLAKFLMLLAKRMATSVSNKEFPIAQFLDDPEALDILPFVLGSSGRVVQAVKARQQNGAVADESQGIAQRLSNILTTCVLEELTNTVLGHLCKHIQRLALANVKAAKSVIGPMELGDMMRKRGGKRKLKQRSPKYAGRSPRTKRFKTSDAFSSDESEECENGDRASSGRCRPQHSSDDDGRGDRDMEEASGEEEKEDEDAFGSPMNVPSSHRNGARRRTANVDSYATAPPVSLHAVSVQKLCHVLLVVQDIVVDVAEQVQAKLEKILKEVEITESVNSTDAERRYVVAGKSICAPYFVLRGAIWDLLLASRKIQACDVAVDDIIRAGRQCLGQLRISETRQLFFDEIFNVKTSRQSLRSWHVEESVLLVMQSLSKYTERCLGVGLGANPRSQSIELRFQLLQQASEMAEDIVTSRVRRAGRKVGSFGESKANDEEGIVLPSPSKLAIARLGVTLGELDFRRPEGDGVSFDGHSTSGRRAVRAICRSTEAMLHDADAKVRIAAAGIAAMFLRLPVFWEELPTLDRFSAFKKLLPEHSFSRDLQTLDSSNRMESIELVPAGNFGLSTTEVLPGFEIIGAASTIVTTLLAIGEVAARCPHHRGGCIEELLQRAAGAKNVDQPAFGVLARVACRTGYGSTVDLFHVFRREILVRWLERKDSSHIGPEKLHDFPVLLVAPGDRRRVSSLAYYEWVGMHVDEILPLILVGDDPDTLKGTRKLADELSTDVGTLLVSYMTHVYRLFPSTFVGSMDGTRASLLWKRVTELAAGSGYFAKLPKVGSGLYDLLCTILMSSSCVYPLTDTVTGENVRNMSRVPDKLGFSRDGSRARAPEYDPIVCASVVNYLCASSSKKRDELPIAITSEQTQGSIFARNGANLDFFSSFGKDKPLLLAHILARVWEGMNGPPNPPSLQSRLNAFASLAVLYRACKSTLLSEVSLRFALFEVIVCGFRFPETAKNALWLLRDATKVYTSMGDSDDVVGLEDSSWLGIFESHAASSMKEFLESRLGDDTAWRWWEILELILPGLFAIGCAPGDDPLGEFARHAAKDMIQRGKSLQGVLGVLDCFPTDVKLFKELRKEQQACFEEFRLDAREKVEFCMLRFTLHHVRASDDPDGLFRRIRYLRLVLEQHRDELRSLLYSQSEAACADSSETSMIRQLASDVVRLLVSIVEECVQSDAGAGPVLLTRSFMERPLVSAKQAPLQGRALSAVEEEAVGCIGIFGAVWPSSLSLATASEESVLSEVESPVLYCATVLLCRELRSPSPVARRVAVETLSSFFASREGKSLWAYASHTPWCKDFSTEFQMYQPTKSAKPHPVALRDPVTGYDVDGAMFDLLADTTWAVSASSGTERSGIPSSWVRKLSASLAKQCENEALSVLQAACFGSDDCAAGLFPHLLSSVIKKHSGNASFIGQLGRVVTAQILEDDAVPLGALRLVVCGIDALCQIGLSQLLSRGGAKKAGGIWWDREIYVLDIPYLTMANAANRCGAFCSALRYATLHVNQASRMHEKQLRERSSGWGRDQSESLEHVKLQARLEAGSVVSNALRHVREPDGQRAVPSRGGIAERAAVIASVESDWSRVLGTQDMLLGFASQRSFGLDDVSRHSSGSRISFARERDILRSMFGLGALHGVVKYWHGFRIDALSQSVGRHRRDLRIEDFDPAEQEAAKDLVDLRYQAAWQLGQWQTPPNVPIGSDMFEDVGIGLHEAIHSCLRSLVSGDVGATLSCVADARSGIAMRMATGMSGSLIASVRDVAHELLLIEDVFLAATVLAQSQEDRGRSFRTLVGSSVGSYPNFVARNTNSEVRAGMDQIAKLKKGFGVPTVGAKSLKQRAGMHEGTGNGGAKGRGRPAGDFDENSIVARFWELCAVWRQRDKSLMHSSGRDGYAQTDPIPRAETVLSLRVALARALGVKEHVAGMSADLASHILRSDNGQGAWSRAAAALGNDDSSFLTYASQVDGGAWKVAEAQLYWQAGEDGSSKQYALRSVKEIINHRLGGSLTSQVQVSEEEVESGALFDMKWSEIDGPSSQSLEIAAVRAEACRLAAEWSGAMRAEEAMTLFQGYLRMGLEAFHNISPTFADNGKCAAHFAMADFADEQMKSILRYRKSKEFAFTVDSVERSHRVVEKLEKKLHESSLAGKQRTAVQRHIKGRLTDLVRDQAKLEKLDAMHTRWRILAAQNYASCLSSGDVHDLQAGFRLVALWTENGVSSPDMNRVLVSRGENGMDCVRVPTRKLLPAAPQIASRIGRSESSLYDRTVSAVFAGMAANHPEHCLWQLIALASLTHEPPPTMKGAELYVADEQKKQAADMIIGTVKKSHRLLVTQTCELARYFFAVSEIPKGSRGQFPRSGPGGRELHVAELNLVAVPTVSLPLYGYRGGAKGPTVRSFEKSAKVLGGKSAPMLLHCIGSDGKKYPLIVKYMDDMRQDAVMEQMFAILNELLSRNEASSARNLWIRTYRVVPLSPFAGIMQFVRNTQQLRTWLLGSDQDSSSGGHERHRPMDMRNAQVCSEWVNKFLRRQSKAEDRVRFMKKVWSRFQPVFRYYFLESYPDPADWHARQLSYTRSCALMSIVGWMIGLGDRHLSNILIDSKTAELIHIDFGYVFEASKLLPTPELMPFRLTRDIIDGMGVDGVEGVFRTCCGVTMQLLRENKDLLLMVFQVFLHDPLFDWSLSPLKVLEDSGSASRGGDVVLGTDDDEEGDDRNSAEYEGVSSPSKEPNGNAEDGGGDKAMYALTRVSEKLDGLEATDRLSVEAHVARLIDEARTVEFVGSAYIGWSPHV